MILEISKALSTLGTTPSALTNAPPPLQEEGGVLEKPTASSATSTIPTHPIESSQKRRHKKEKPTGTRQLSRLREDMGRTRGNFHSTAEDPTQRSRRKKKAVSGENSESSSPGQGSSGGKRALYHCNYCNTNITEKIRIKCAECLDFDLCVECFSTGAEVTPHKSNHPYRVMDTLSFSLFSPDWNADEEMLLLEGIEMYGFGNWGEVAEHVGTKSKETCIEHYNSVYMQSPCFPLPDMSRVAGKNKKELIAVAKAPSDREQNSRNHDGDSANIGGIAADNSADVE